MNIRRAAIGIILIELIILVIAFSQYGNTVEALQAATRYSGRFSLLIFSFIFLLNKKPGHLDLIIFGKPYHAFALAHGIHLIEVMLFVYLGDRELNPTRALGGFINYIYIFTMPVLWDKWKSEKLSVRIFRSSETIFLYFTWLLFFLTYLPRVTGKIQHVGGTYMEHVILLGWVSLLIGMKIISLLAIKPREHRK